MSFSSKLSNFCQYMWNHYSKDGGKLLVHMGAAGWVLSSAAQIFMLMGDKSIDKKQKKFLMPQELADAGVNVIMYYSICEFIKRGGDFLVEKGLFLSEKVAKEILNLKPSNMPELALKDWKKLFSKTELKGKLSKLLKSPQNLEIFKKAASTTEKNHITEAAKKALNVFENHKNNVGTLSAIAASVLACNIITPIVRNKLAAKMQKKLQYNEDVETRKRQITTNITTKNPLPTSFKAFNNYNTFSGIKIN